MHCLHDGSLLRSSPLLLFAYLLLGCSHYYYDDVSLSYECECTFHMMQARKQDTTESRTGVRPVCCMLSLESAEQGFQRAELNMLVWEQEQR
jgi:hypothetical protein